MIDAQWLDGLESGEDLNFEARHEQGPRYETKMYPHGQVETDKERT